MTIQELKSTIRLCVESDGNINVEIFVLLKNQEIKKANFLQVLQPEVVTMFTSVITNQLLEADYTVLNASSADERKDVVYYYDLEPTERLHVFQQVQNGENVFPYFSFSNDAHSVSSEVHALLPPTLIFPAWHSQDLLYWHPTA